MREIPNVRQIPGEPVRRWFSSADFDLIVWQDPNGELNGFELCYDKRHNERSLAWHPQTGFRHMGVDDGEQRPGKYKATPILVADGPFDADAVGEAFRSASGKLPADIAAHVLRALEQYPHSSA